MIRICRRVALLWIQCCLPREAEHQRLITRICHPHLSFYDVGDHRNYHRLHISIPKFCMIDEVVMVGQVRGPVQERRHAGVAQKSPICCEQLLEGCLSQDSSKDCLSVQFQLLNKHRKFVACAWVSPFLS